MVEAMINYKFKFKFIFIFFEPISFKKVYAFSTKYTNILFDCSAGRMRNLVDYN